MTKITSIESYLQWVRECKTLKNEAGIDFEQHYLYFRGQADADWLLEPSVFRGNNDEFSLLKDSYNYAAWMHLQNCNSDLEKMIMLQHYGLHTRLLDLTSNPLIALYFACVEENNKDGKVFCYCAKGVESTCIPQIIAKSVVNDAQNSLGFEQFLQDEYDNFFVRNNRDSREGFDVWKEEIYKPQFFISPYNNDRITAQRGAFIIAPLVDSENATYPLAFHNQIEKMENWHDDFAIIEASCKENLLAELAQLGIDASTVYPDFEHLLQHLNKKHSNKSADNNFKVEIGDIMLEDKTIIKPSQWLPDKKAVGIVFYVDETGKHGHAVHIEDQSISIKMATSEEYVRRLPFLEHSEGITHDGYNNTRIMRETGDETQFPAAWRVDFENGWYIPAQEQMEKLAKGFRVTGENHRRKINESLEKVNGKCISFKYLRDSGDEENKPYYFWSSTQVPNRLFYSFFFCTRFDGSETLSSEQRLQKHCHLRSICNF